MKFCLISFAVLTSVFSFGQSVPGLRNADKVRIKEAMNTSTQFGDKLFEGYNAVPFAIVLITDSIEFLINHPNPSSDFKLVGKDSALNTDIYYRKRQFNPTFLATFPAVNGLSCIVVGTPENTKKNSTEWIITLLHEHFHQYQNAAPDYYQEVNELNLSGGDQTGMWMLNYPFPYDSLPVRNQYELYTKVLLATINNINGSGYNANLEQYLSERKKFKSILSDSDYRYFSFQVWQEGLARYTEFNFLEMLTDYIPSKEVLALPGFISFPDLKIKMQRNETKNLLANKLNESKRVCFYSIGFAEGIILDKLNDSWRKNYLSDKFYIENYSNKLH
jgi:hypothetical protein